MDRVVPQSSLAGLYLVCRRLPFLGSWSDQRRIKRVLDSPGSQDKFVSRPAVRLNVRELSCCCRRIISDSRQRVKI
jgi:hypothetical protein